jgi:hypothetical protein
MNQNQIDRLDALKKIQLFLNQHAVLLGRLHESASRADLDAAVAKIGEHAARQREARIDARNLALHKERLREALRLGHLRPLVAVARYCLHNTTATHLVVPRKNQTDAALINGALAVASIAEPHLARLTEDRCLGLNVITQLRAAVAAVEDVCAAHKHSHCELSVATLCIRDELSRVQGALRILDALVISRLRCRPEMIRAWQLAKRVTRPKAAIVLRSSKVAVALRSSKTAVALRSSVGSAR